MPQHASGQRQYAYLESVAASRRRFPNALRIADTVYASSQPPVSVRAPSPADIRDQTHQAFRDFVDLLGAVGVHMADLVKLHTFYIYGGGGDGTATAFWERMTEVRLQYFANPGPCGTALRVKGAPVHDRLIAIDGVASSSAARTRLMPAHAWDWSMPTPLSQGWRIGNVVYAGGQISADRRGRTVAPDDLAQQTINTMEFLRHVFLEAGASFEHVVALKIGYQHRGDDAAARDVLDAILRIVRPMFAPGQCVLTCLGIDLLYDGLQLEIDATAVVDAPTQRRVAGKGADGCGSEGFATTCRVGAHVFAGGISAAGRATIAEQLSACIDRLDASLREVGSRLVDLVKLNVLFCAEASAELADAASVDEVLRARLSMPGPVVTIVRVAGLPNAQQLVQVDAVAVIDRAD